MRRLLRNRGCWLMVWLALALIPGGLTDARAATGIPTHRKLALAATVELKVKAEAGDPAAQEAYAVQLEAAQYFADAAKWYRRAAETGRVEAQFRLGSLLLKSHPRKDANGSALVAQPSAGIHWLTQAATQDHPMAQLALGNCYRTGAAVAANPVEAYRWYLLAAERLDLAARERDRLALKLNSEQIQKAVQQAASFRAGDLSDPRIRIVTQPDLREPSSAGITTDKSRLQRPASAGPNSTPSSDTEDSLPTEFGTTVTREAVASASDLEKGKAGNNPLGGVYRMIFWLVAICGIASLGLVALVVIVAEIRQRRKGQHSSSACFADQSKIAPPGKSPPRPPRLPTALERLRALDRHQFENLIEGLFTLEGYQVTRCSEAQPDGGIDLELVRDETRTAVQCKHWKHQQVGIKEVRDFLGALTAGQFQHGILVTISNYTVAALEFARRNQIEIMDGAHVLARLERDPVKPDAEVTVIPSDTDKRCPKCESPMVPRESRPGPNAGGRFWGCSTFPRCRFVTPA